MNADDFKYLSNLVKDRSGILIGEDKAYLLESRLSNVIRKHKYESISALVATLQLKFNEELVTEVVDAMTTNESLFFRDMKPFNLMRSVVLPKLMPARANKKLRVWSAACSSGQEAYSLAITFDEEKAKYPGSDLEILGTDISPKIIEKAQEGLYTQFEIQRGLPITMLVKYFTQADTNWRVKDEMKKGISFKYFNLMDSPSALGKFDVVFCRNVLIYFDRETKAKVLDGVYNVLANDGFLFLGGAESVMGVTDKFELVPGERSIYQKVTAQASGAMHG